MAMVWRVAGGLMMVYAALYLAQFLFSTLYDNPQPVWDVMNYVSGLGILVALIANFGHMRSQSGSDEPTLSRLGRTRAVLRQRGARHLVLPQLDIPAGTGRGRIRQRTRRRHLGLRRRHDPDRPCHHRPQALANERLTPLRRTVTPLTLGSYECYAVTSVQDALPRLERQTKRGQPARSRRTAARVMHRTQEVATW